jgi:hypothetical protein
MLILVLKSFARTGMLSELLTGFDQRKQQSVADQITVGSPTGQLLTGLHFCLVKKHVLGNFLKSLSNQDITDAGYEILDTSFISSKDFFSFQSSL